MDKNSVAALISGLLMLIVAGSVFAITGSRPVPSVPIPDPRTIVASSFAPALQMAGGWAPYSILFGGPIADIYYQEFRYTILTVISLVGMTVGVIYYSILHGTGGFVNAFVLGTCAAITYLIQDAWVQKMSLENQVITTVFGILGVGITALVSGGPLALTSILGAWNALLGSAPALLLGAGIGELSWVTTYNVARDRLPFAKRS